ncbi:MAG: hypothetical protein QNJ09_18435 [Paracoccaceae bacterium]|nr:hypothetical protein [Paracoccaceae bacterium]
MAQETMDGRYKAEGTRVYRSPTKTETGMKMGFLVCTVSQNLDAASSAAEEIAEALNMHMDAHPERH